MTACTFVGIEYGTDTVDTAHVTANVPAGTANGDRMFMAINFNNGTPATPSGWTLLNSQASNTAFYTRAASSEPASYTFNISAGAWTLAQMYIITYRNWGANGVDQGVRATNNSFDTYVDSLWMLDYYDAGFAVYKHNCPYIFIVCSRRSDAFDPLITVSPTWAAQRGTHILSTGAVSHLFQVYDYIPTHWGAGEPEGFWAMAQPGSPHGRDTSGYLLWNEENAISPADGVDPPHPLAPDRVKFNRRMKFAHLPYDLNRTMTREL